MTSRVQFRLRIYKDEGVAIGPGKVALLEAVAEYGSISAAARHLGMSYRRAWLLIDETNHAFNSPQLKQQQAAVMAVGQRNRTASPGGSNPLLTGI